MKSYDINDGNDDVLGEDHAFAIRKVVSSKSSSDEGESKSDKSEKPMDDAQRAKAKEEIKQQAAKMKNSLSDSFSDS